jgi:hypothetical protein
MGGGGEEVVARTDASGGFRLRLWNPALRTFVRFEAPGYQSSEPYLLEELRTRTEPIELVPE